MLKGVVLFCATFCVVLALCKADTCNPATCANGACNAQGTLCSCATGYFNKVSSIGESTCVGYCESDQAAAFTDLCGGAAAGTCQNDFTAVPYYYTCSCNAGYKLQTVYNPTCVAIDYCAGSPCGTGGTCTIDLTSPTDYTCACSAGYSNIDGLNYNACEDYCKANPDVCGGTGVGTCQFNSAKAPYYSCSCAAGYVLLNGTCVTDTCGQTADKCGTAAAGTCSNTAAAPGYECTCNAGYGNIDSTVTGQCVDYCSVTANANVCGASDAGVCSFNATSPYYHDCKCFNGYVNKVAGNTSSICQKATYCQMNPSVCGDSAYSTCESTDDSSYTCSCKENLGYFNEGGVATGKCVNYCQANPTACGKTSDYGTCSFTSGATSPPFFTCQCKSPYVPSVSGNISSPCVSVADACSLLNCPAHSTCPGSNGNVNCTCDNGYSPVTSSGAVTSCVNKCDNFACTAPNTVCSTENASYEAECVCVSGYVKGDNGCVLPSGGSGGGNSNLGLIIGLSVGLGGLAIVAAFGTWWFCYDRKKKIAAEEAKVNQAMEEATFYVGGADASKQQLPTGREVSAVPSMPAMAPSPPMSAHNSVNSGAPGSANIPATPNRAGLQFSTAQLLDDDDAVYDEPTNRS
eukprot:Nk52_evm28s288 gene=Nk52_evmTU28s288